MTICLNMIVRNEAGVVTRLLDSVHGLIDYWVICDTGSIDDTPALIQDYFRARRIPGELHHCAWRDFGHNRTQALDLADGKADYILLLDADMILHHSSAFDRDKLAADSYTIRQDSGDLSYYNRRLLKSGLDWTCIGPTHEYYASPRARQKEMLDTLWIEDRNDGGCRTNKFERDIELLEQAVANEPGNSRHHFYLGESYRNADLPEKAVAAYQHRIELGGWDEETWYAMYKKGAALADLGRTGEAIAALEDAFRCRPWRAEPLLALVRVRRESGDYEAALSLAEEGRKLSYPVDDTLFVDRTAHDWRFDHELTISAFHAGRMESGRAACERLLANRDLPSRVRTNVLNNLAYYVPRLSVLTGEEVRQQVIEAADVRWRFTNPSLCPRDAGGYWLNLRQVDYRLQWPEYRLRETGLAIDDDHPASTENVRVVLDDELQVVDSGCRVDVNMDDAPLFACRARGYEDGRLFCFQGSLWLSTQTPQHSEDGLSRICLLKLDHGGEATLLRLRGSCDGTRHEKNWMPFVHEGSLHYVYMCEPLTIFKVDVETGHCSQISATSPAVCCDGFRGGSQGIPFDDGYLFVVHQVAETRKRRCYFQRFILVGGDFKLRAVSDAFCLNSPAIEYVAGLAADASGESLVLSWGSNDERAILARISAAAVRRVLRYLPLKTVQ